MARTYELLIWVCLGLTLIAGTRCEAGEPIYTGQVLIKNPNLLVVSGTNISAWVHPVSNSLIAACREGDIVRVTGAYRNPGQYATGLNRITAEAVEVIGRQPLPSDIEVMGGQIPDGSLNFTFVRTRGILISVVRGDSSSWNWAVLQTPTGNAGVAIRDAQYSYAQLRKLIDAEVSVRGIVVYSWGSASELGAHLSLRGEDALKVITPAPADPFAAPEFEKIAPGHRQTIKGVIIAKGSRNLMVETPNRGTIRAIPAIEAVLPEIGHAVTMAGFARTDPVRLLFSEALFRDEGLVGVPDALPHVPDQSLQRIGGYHGRLITVDGTVTGVVADRGVASELTIDTPHGLVAVDLTPIRPDFGHLPPVSSVVRITGVCVTEYEASSPNNAFPRFRSVAIIPRYASDLIVIRRPPWWTSTKVAIAVIVLLGLAWLRVYLSRAATRLKLRERMSLAIEVHDSLAQFLTGISLQIDAAELAEASGAQAAAREHVSSARKALQACRENLRYCLGDLRRNPFVSANIGDVLRDAILPYVGTAKLLVRFNLPRRRLADELVHALTSMVRELAINAVRHGHARRILVAGELREGRVRVSVHDDGCGFVPADCPGTESGHYGLSGVRERLAAYNGELVIRSQPGSGSKIIISLSS